MGTHSKLKAVLAGYSKRIARFGRDPLEVEAFLRPAPQGGRGGRCSGGAAAPPIGASFVLFHSDDCVSVMIFGVAKLLQSLGEISAYRLEKVFPAENMAVLALAVIRNPPSQDKHSTCIPAYHSIIRDPIRGHM